MKIFDLIKPEAVATVTKVVEKLEYADGRLTARGKAKDIKENLQITESNKEARPLFSTIKKLIHSHLGIESYAMIKEIVGMRIACYRDGGYYGWHVDMAAMKGVRTDLSFTIFLNDPSSYDGGELQIDYGTSVKKFKGKVGQIVVYPTGQLHQVTPVTKGERLVLVGWINSCIPLEEDRIALMRMGMEIQKLSKLLPADKDVELNQLRYLHQQFRRRFYN
jgi:PKHD-type hydroxylase